jgi:hypothetical protein
MLVVSVSAAAAVVAEGRRIERYDTGFTTGEWCLTPITNGV